MAIDTEGLRSRRSILFGALGGLAAGVAAAIGSSVPADAAATYVKLGDVNTTTHRTTIVNTENSGLFASAASGTVGVEGDSDYGSGVYGYVTSLAGVGVDGRNANGGVALRGYTSTTNEALSSYLEPIGVHGIANHGSRAVGVYGESDTGRGAYFYGPVAQVRLSPANQKHHPASGARGDLFVDSTGRLWFCKGGTTWHQLA
jgi:hypothetical protein